MTPMLEAALAACGKDHLTIVVARDEEERRTFGDHLRSLLGYPPGRLWVVTAEQADGQYRDLEGVRWFDARTWKQLQSYCNCIAHV